MQKFQVGERVFLLQIWKITGCSIQGTVVAYDERTGIYTVTPDGARYGNTRFFEEDLSRP